MRKQTIGKVRGVEKVKYSEADLAKFTTNLLQYSGLFWRRVPVGVVAHSVRDRIVYKKSPLKGMTDYFGLTHEGTGWFLELKTKVGKISPIQEAVHHELRQSNAFVSVCRTPDEVVTFIMAMGGRIKTKAPATAKAS